MIGERLLALLGQESPPFRPYIYPEVGWAFIGIAILTAGAMTVALLAPRWRETPGIREWPVLHRKLSFVFLACMLVFGIGVLLDQPLVWVPPSSAVVLGGIWSSGHNCHGGAEGSAKP